MCCVKLDEYPIEILEAVLKILEERESGHIFNIRNNEGLASEILLKSCGILF